MQATSENRSLNRFPCCIAVTGQSRSASLGQITNISLDGIFITTPTPLAEGAVVPTVFNLGKDGPEIRPEAEVIRRTPDGMGLRFLNLTRQDSRRLRRYVAEVASVVGHRDLAGPNLQDAEGRQTAPIADPDRIRELFSQSVGKAKFTAIPATRNVRETANLIRVDGRQLDFRTAGTCELTIGEQVLVLYTHDYISYSFPAKVTSVESAAFSVTFPDQLHYSERRSAASARATATGTTFHVPLPWRQGEVASWPVCDTSATGLSFRAEPRDVYFWPGTTLPEASLHGPTGDRAIAAAIVKHLTAMRDEKGNDWVKVGIAFGVERAAAQSRDEAMESDVLPQSSGGLNKVVTWGRGVAAKATYLYHSKVRRMQHADREAPFHIIRFPNRAGHPLVGLLNCAFADKGKTRAPLVIITPGFGARKETVSALAAIMADNFRRQHRDIAILRFDGSNNIGESYKAPGCEGEGRNNLKFTVSDGVNDLLGALSWAKNNKFVDPTDIIVISVSFSSIAVRHALTLPETRIVSRWITFMGAPDAQNAVMNVGGNADFYGAFINGKKVGTVSLLGCMVDFDHYGADAQKLGVATLEDARREMAMIHADVTWVIGKHDAFMDPDRVKDIMNVKAPGKREIVQVNAGHVPQSSDEALAEFVLMTRYVWRHLYGRDLDATVPSRGLLAALAEQEWHRVRHERLENSEAWWKDYLLGDGGIGFDVWSLTPNYRQLIDDQTRLADVRGLRVLDLGAGTGNMSRALAHQAPIRLTAIDLVPEALERARQKVGNTMSFQAVSGSIDGNPKTAMRRFLAGDLPNLTALMDRLPASHRRAIAGIASAYTPRLHAILRGAELDIEQALRDAGQPTAHAPFVKDVNILARLMSGTLSEEAAVALASVPFKDLMRGPAGLPFADASFDCIICSLVLSYMEHPRDTLFEARRVLAPGGRLVISTMLPDFDTSVTYMDSVKLLESMDDGWTHEGHSKEELLTALRRLLNNGMNLTRMQEEGVFQFWTGAHLAALVHEAGFQGARHQDSSGDPPQAVIVTCQRP